MRKRKQQEDRKREKVRKREKRDKEREGGKDSGRKYLSITSKIGGSKMKTKIANTLAMLHTYLLIIHLF